MPVFPFQKILEKIALGHKIQWPLANSASHSYRIMRVLEKLDAGAQVAWCTSNESDRDHLFSNATTLASLPQFQNIQVHIWSAWEFSPYAPVSPSVAALQSRLNLLHALHNTESKILVVTDYAGWAQPTLPAEEYTKSRLHLKAGELYERDQVNNNLRKLGYIRTESVEEPGQFAWRGDILDLFPVGQNFPMRIDWFDIEIEGIRFFDPRTQRTLPATAENTKEFFIAPATEVLIPFQNIQDPLEKIKEFSDHHDLSRKIRDPIVENLRAGFLPENAQTWIPILYGKTGLLSDHLKKGFFLGANDPTQGCAQLDEIRNKQKEDYEKYKTEPRICPTPEMLFAADSRAQDLINKALWQQNTLGETDRDEFLPESILDKKNVTPSKIKSLRQEGFRVFIGSRTRSNQERTEYLLGERSDILAGDISHSFEIPEEKTAFIHEADFFGRSRTHAQKATNKSKQFSADEIIELRTLSDIRVGDHVVHSTHGVGKYTGLIHLKSKAQGETAEYLVIEYAQGDKLYLPVYRLNLIHKYVGSGAGSSLDRLGSGGFEKAKQKARDEVRKLAINLIEVYAKRKLVQGPKFNSRNEDYEKFADDFEFAETEGQIQAIDETLDDLESGTLTDRLICGDVGFGKTEVAMRAAFQAVQSGYQVAVLVPTTLLAFQHENNFKHRFRNFPIRIESVSRFKSRGHQKKVLEDCKAGKVDILIGTHRLLSKDVEWARLGLMIVDEEHRFGVEHKERIRSIQTSTHTITLTATPIPRTLHMAFSGLKSITIMKTPPSNRQPIKTFVSANSEELVKSAIQQEIDRGGQVFYLFNRVATIQAKAKELQQLVPQAKILVAHGQMNETEVEEKMMDFYQGNAQVLLCTTIIESGIDIPRAGTIIIHRADLFGLAQLYQIRGRVGRSHRKAFAYLLVSETGTLTDDAKQRLEVIQRFVELGSGFQIASYDLELRGGGNLLGAEQSGHIAAVGLDLFMEMLQETMAELQGNPNALQELSWEPEIQIPYLCEIHPDTIPDTQLRLSLYRRLSGASSIERVEQMKQEFEDRFGKLEESTENLFWLIKFKVLFKKCGIETFALTPSQCTFTARKVTLIDPDEVMKSISGPKGIRDPRLKIMPDSKLVFTHVFQNMAEAFFEVEGLIKKLAPKAFS